MYDVYLSSIYIHVKVFWRCDRSQNFGRELVSPKQHPGIPWTSTTTSSTAFATICTLFCLSRLDAWDVSKLDALLPYLPYLVWMIRAYELPNWTTKELWKRKKRTDMKITWRSWNVSQTLGRMSGCQIYTLQFWIRALIFLRPLHHKFPIRAQMFPAVFSQDLGRWFFKHSEKLQENICNVAACQKVETCNTHFLNQGCIHYESQTIVFCLQVVWTSTGFCHGLGKPLWRSVLGLRMLFDATRLLVARRKVGHYGELSLFFSG